MNRATMFEQPMRQAALTLHALCDPDREWLLSALSAAHRASLQPLLEDLRQLGIPRDAGVLQDVLEHHREPMAVPVEPAGQWVRCDAAALGRVLQAEPLRLAALVLAAQPCWRKLLLTSFAPEDRMRLEELAASHVGGPALQAALSAAIARRVEQSMPGKQPAPDGSFWGRTKARALAWRSAR